MIGRPKYKDPEDKREHCLLVRFNEKEYKELEEFSQDMGVPMAAIVRKSVHYYYAQKYR